MRGNVITAVLVLAVIVGASASPAAPQTSQPGQMTPARVWVQNRNRGDAVAVDLRDVNLEKPLRVHVVNAEAGSSEATPPVQTRAARQLWEYETVGVPAGMDAAAILNSRGASGWEAVGMMNVTADGITFLLKRPR